MYQRQTEERFTSNDGKVVLSRKGLARLEQHHPWVFSSDILATPNLPTGSLVPVGDKYRTYAWGFWNPDTSLAVRLLSWKTGEPHVERLLAERLRDALMLRRRWCAGDQAFRWVHGEADGLPGLIVDIFGPVAVVQTLSSGWYQLRDVLKEKLHSIHTEIRLAERDSSPLTPLETIILRNDGRHLSREGIPLETTLLHGHMQEDEGVVVRLGEIDSMVYPLRGQKTGAYLDVRTFPQHLHPVASGARVLDAFCYAGNFSLHLAKWGAKAVIAVDQSEEALDLAIDNQRRNNIPNVISWACGNAFDLIRELDGNRERFDVIVMDPPPFAPSKAHLASARKGYKELALRALRMLNPGGTLLYCSCSAAFTRDMLVETLHEASLDAKRDIRLLEELQQPADHPALPGMPEGNYLKGVVVVAG